MSVLHHTIIPDHFERNGLYDKLDENLKTRGTKLAFHVSQAVWTPDLEKWKMISSPPRSSLYRWTELQYQANGPFDKWLKTVETCRTNVKCCENPRGIGNIVIRDFPTPDFGSIVVNKNFQYATRNQRKCEENLMCEIATKERENNFVSRARVI